MKNFTVRRCAVGLVSALVLAALWFGVVFASFSSPAKDAMRKATRATLQNVRTAMEMYQVDCGRWPPTDGWFHSLTNAGGIAGWKGPYLRDLTSEPTDSWGTKIEYTVERDKPHFRSAGRDKRLGTSDDIVNE